MDAKELIRWANDSLIVHGVCDHKCMRDRYDQCENCGASGVALQDDMVARHILATVQPDDGEAATREWLETLAPNGEVWDEGEIVVNASVGRLVGSWHISIDRHRNNLCLSGSANPIMAKPTRGDVRRLLAALGIEAKGGA